MLKRFVKFICVMLCIAMLLPFTAVAEGNREWSGEVPPLQEATHHIDITDGSWYANNCRYVYHNGLMAGTSETEFSPHEVLTREMAVVILAAIVKYQHNPHHESYSDDWNVPEYTYSSFKDVEVGKWYSDSIQWAYEHELVAGIGDGYFGVGQSISREDFLVMLYNPIIKATDHFKYEYQNGISEYQGEEEISEYAGTAVGFFTSILAYVELSGNYNSLDSIPHIINAYPDGLYHFKNTLTRAEAATMVAIYTYLNMGGQLFNYRLAVYKYINA